MAIKPRGSKWGGARQGRPNLFCSLEKGWGGLRDRVPAVWGLRIGLALAITMGILCLGLTALPGHVAAADGEFSLQVSPSPLVTTLKPGLPTTLELNIRNAGPKAENLKSRPAPLKVDPGTQKLQINDTEQPEIASWISFSAPAFTVQSGQTITEKITLSTPKEAAFSYSFVLVISRAENPQQPPAGRILKGSVAIFTLVNVDRPGALSALTVAGFSTTKRRYEYLPAEFEVKLKNTGNTIVRPSGTIFVQRSAKDKIPIDTLAVNSGKGYILPDNTRTLSVAWENGFPVTRSVTAADGTVKQQLVWDWSKLSDLRFGRYTAKLVAVYDDGKRDVPIQSQVTFWVIPWKLLLAALFILLLIAGGVWSFASKIVRLAKRIKK